MAENTELQVLQNQQIASNSFDNKDSFEHIQRVATVFSKSDMVPKRYFNNIANCIIALEMANRMGASPLMVMQNLDIIQGKPGWSSMFLIATLNSCGKFSPLRYEDDNAEGGRTRAYAVEKETNETLKGVWVSMNMAKAEGWIDKTGSKWKTMPELMMRYRAASFFTKQFAPEVSMGLQTVEELTDITPTPDSGNRANATAALLRETTYVETPEVLNESRGEENQDPYPSGQSDEVPQTGGNDKSANKSGH